MIEFKERTVRLVEVDLHLWIRNLSKCCCPFKRSQFVALESWEKRSTLLAQGSRYRPISQHTSDPFVQPLPRRNRITQSRLDKMF